MRRGAGGYRGRARAAIGIVAATALPFGAPPAASAQVEAGPLPVRAVAFRADPLSPEFGRAFDLHVTLRVAPGTLLLLPDTLVPGEASQSAGRATWTTAEGPGDSLDVVTTYPVMGLSNGEVQLPTLEAATAPAPGPDAMVASLDGTAEGLAQGAGRPFALSIGRVQVVPHRVMADVEGTPVVRPPADVAGAYWSVWAIAAGLIALGIAALGVYAAVALWTEWSARRSGATLRRVPRRDALAALDRLLGRGWHRQGRIDAFYQEASEIFRGFAAKAQASWGEDLTSTELVREIAAREGDESTEDLRPAVLSGEGVRFGTDRPDATRAEAHVGAIARWIAGTGSAPSDPGAGDPSVPSAEDDR